MSSTKIEWTDVTWNPVTGCTPISDGCLNCYAAIMARRLRAMGNPRYRNEFSVTLQTDLLETPFKWKKKRMVFVNSMGDLFHEEVPLDYIKQVFAAMAEAKQHIFQVLTKRSSRMFNLSPHLEWSDNVWMGVTIESNQYVHRADNLRRSPAKVKFLSIEPMLDAVQDLDLFGIDWVIVGGESGPKSRPIEKKWVIDLRDRCLAANIPFFFKQWGGTNKKAAGRLLEGKTWDQYPILSNK